VAATPVPAIAFSTPLTSDHGRHFSLGELRGKWVWLYFGYTNCPDLCPLTLSHLAGAYRALAHPEQVQVVFVSIDPGRDTPDHLAEYAGYFHPSFWGATSGEGAIDPLAHALGVKYRVNPDNQLGDYEVSHSNQVYLIDPAGGLAAAVTVKTPDDALKLAQDLNTAAAKPKLLGRPFQNLSGDSGRLCSTDPALQALMDHQQTSGSGTSVLPLATPMRMWSFASRDWLWMLGGDAILGFNDQMGPRGARANSAENWEMAMASRYVGKDILDLRLMTSLERWVLPALGTAQLFQTGESYNFNPIVDHQHPHAPVMELAGRYTAELADRSELFLYGGLVGDPALGPTTYLHRPSAADNHWSPLGHHLQDSTHESAGVITVGGREGDFKVEASSFNARENDQATWMPNWGPLDSWSTRLSYFPGRHWSAQWSYGYLTSPEILHPGDEQRMTASILNVSEWPWGTLSTQLVWGQNVEYHFGSLNRQSYGLESQADWTTGLHLYGRFEAVDKEWLPPEDYLSHAIHRVNALTLGAAQDLGFIHAADVAVGGDVTADAVDPVETALYGGPPVSFQIYVRVRPPLMRR
jgi:cytochrome oxidase Cu insertion factor (SCO1/SenC/PrrC family)